LAKVNKPIFKIIEHGGDDYKKSVSLREEILRKPVGLIYLPEECKPSIELLPKSRPS
jgi:hypothetical protein